jgi:beta-1,4-mannosyl-glycoprotein beta-1,4-N-acetylglucosaminyltransferase
MRVDLSYILNELDVLEVRLNILNDYVDKFVIIESLQTFSGVAKEPCFDIESPRWSKWKDKISYHLIKQPFSDMGIYKMALQSPNTGNHEHYWVREFCIKEHARRALEALNLSDDDIVFISDMDEIWNPALTYEPHGVEVLKPKQLPYLYYFNQRTDEDWLGWTGTTVCRYETIKNGIINHIRTDDLTPYTVIENGGWHFNSIGGKAKKIAASKHPVVSSQSDWTRREVNMRVDESDLPAYLLTNKETWKKLFL